MKYNLHILISMLPSGDYPFVQKLNEYSAIFTEHPLPLITSPTFKNQGYYTTREWTTYMYQTKKVHTPVLLWFLKSDMVL